MATCRSCGASIVFARTSKGRRLPVDSEPNPEGNVRLYRMHDDTDVHAVIVGNDYAGERYMPHHATCPEGRSWSKRRKGSKRE